jgi:hypothetical protein
MCCINIGLSGRVQERVGVGLARKCLAQAAKVHYFLSHFVIHPKPAYLATLVDGPQL